MIGQRTRYSFAQFLELQEPMISIVLLGKYGAQHLSLSHGQLLYGLLNTLRDLDDRTLMLALAEVVATAGDLRARVNPKYRFDERQHDLAQCLLLDGYIIQEQKADSDRSVDFRCGSLRGRPDRGAAELRGSSCARKSSPRSMIRLARFRARPARLQRIACEPPAWR